MSEDEGVTVWLFFLSPIINFVLSPVSGSLFVELRSRIEGHGPNRESFDGPEEDGPANELFKRKKKVFTLKK